MTALDRVIEALPGRYQGPGGACAVLRDGEVVVRHAWGWANAERRIPFTPQTLFRMCSITKQFTSGLVVELFPDLALDAEVRATLPKLRQSAPTTATLCHNQSGLRDYWAEAMLHGSPVAAPFGDREAAAVIGRTETLQFAPGTRYSYCNQNFRVLSDIMQARTGRSFGELLRERIFDPAGMPTAFLAADTRAMPDGTEGYEGTQQAGFRAADNQIVWTGDAGLGASLDDMIAWERYIDGTRDEADSLYRRLSAPVSFADGAPAEYGFGLSRATRWGRAITGHGGALRGWRSHRLNIASERLSVVVLFNHLSDAHVAAMEIAAAVLDAPDATPSAEAQLPPVPQLTGVYLEPESGLAVRIEAGAPGRVRLQYDRYPDLLEIQGDGSAGTEGPRLRHDGAGLWMDRPVENQSTCLQPVEGAARLDVAGRFACRELGTEIEVADAGGTLYGAFSGFLGQGRMELLEHAGGDVWMLPCPRALDHTPPGDWTLAFKRDGDGRVARVQVGCWLARGLVYELT